MDEVRDAVKNSYGKLLAVLASKTNGDLATAEESLSSAVLKALELWPKEGVPKNPEAWLVQVAKNKIIDNFRHKQVEIDALRHLIDGMEDKSRSNPMVDRRLELMFVCTHPSIDEKIRTPLILRFVLGVKIKDIAALFLISPLALEKRLLRAKHKIRDARIPFVVPEENEFEARLDFILEAIYSIFSIAWDEFDEEFEQEAIFLGELLINLLPNEPEPKGLQSLMLYSSSRKHARRANGVYVPFEEQRVSDWDHAKIRAAENLLVEASHKKHFGRFQIEAAIQSALIQSRASGTNIDADICQLYETLLTIAPSVGATVSFAAALTKMGEFERAGELLDELDPKPAKQYQPFWVTNAYYLQSIGYQSKARDNYSVALGLSVDPSIKKYLANKIAELDNLESEEPT